MNKQELWAVSLLDRAAIFPRCSFLRSFADRLTELNEHSEEEFLAPSSQVRTREQAEAKPDARVSAGLSPKK